MKKKIINSNIFADLIQDSKIVLLDGGARGELFSPFDKVNKQLLTIIKIEPDESADVERHDNEIILRKAIWAKKENIKIHIANEPSVSSVYPPNIEFAGRFIDIIGKPARLTKKVVDVDGDSIDNLFEENGLEYPDFIKLDIHGCEYEAMFGAINSIKNKTVSLLIESWLIEAHHNQKLLFETDKLLFENGFYPYETNIGKWDYKNADNLFSKPQAVISESLYFKDIVHRQEKMSRIGGLKLLAIAELYGHTGFALLLAEYLTKTSVISENEKLKIEKEIKINNYKSSWEKFNSRVKTKLVSLITQNESF